VASAMASAGDAGLTDKAAARRKAWRSRQDRPAAGQGAVYGLGMIGAMVYFFGSAQSGRDRVLAIPKASVWPALLVYRLLKSVSG